MPGRERDINLHVKTDSDNRGLVNAARELEKLGRGADAAGGNLRDFANDAKSLEKQIALTQARVKELGTQFARTGDTSLFGDLKKERSFLRELERISKESGGRGGRGFSGAFLDSLSSLPSLGRGALIGGVVALVAAAAPAIGAALAGAVTGAVGLGGIAGGIASAAKDPRVRSAASAFAKDIGKEFFGGGGAFVEPTIRALDILEQGFKDLDLDEAFAKLAPSVEIVAQGIADMGRSFMPGFNKALDAARPALEVFARELPDIGAAFGDMLAQIAQSKGTLEGLHALLDLVSGSLRVLGDVVSWLGDRFHEGITAAANLSGGLEDVFGWVPVVGDQFRGANDHFEEWLASGEKARVILAGVKAAATQLAPGIETVGEAARDAGGNLAFLSGALDANRVAFLKWSGAEIDVEDALDRFQEALKKSKGSLDVHHEVSRLAKQDLIQFADAARVARDRKFEETGSVEKANTVYAHYRTELYNTFIQAGKTKAEAKKLVDVWLSNPKSVATKVETPGLAAANRSLSGFAGKLDAIDGRVVRSYVKTFYQEFRAGERSSTGRQHGGPVMAGHAYLVGEKRPELFVPSHSGRIEPRLPTGGHSGGNTYNLNVSVAPGADLREYAAVTVRALQDYEKRNGASWRN